MRETRLRWFGYVKRRSENVAITRCKMITILECKRGIGRSKKNWKEIIKEDLNFLGLQRI